MQNHSCYLVLGLGCLVLLCGVKAAPNTACRQDPGACIFASVTAFLPADLDLHTSSWKPAETWSTRMLQGVKVNSVTTHLGIGDLLAYDLIVGADRSPSADGATGTKVNYNTVSVAQAAGLNNVTCLSQQCSQPSAQSAGSVTPLTGASGNTILAGDTLANATGGLKAATQTTVNSSSAVTNPTTGTSATVNVQSGSASVKSATSNAAATVSSAASAGAGSAASKQTASTESFGSASNGPTDNTAACAEVVQQATGSSDVVQGDASKFVNQPGVLHCYLLLAAQQG